MSLPLAFPPIGQRIRRGTITWIIPCVVILLHLLAASKTWTWLVISDPATYVRMARWFLLEGPSAWWGADRQVPLVTPGFPLYLVPWMAIGGARAAFWANLLPVIAMSLLLFVWLRRHTSSLSAGVGIAAWNAWFILGTPDSPHYFFHPFRDPLMMCLLMASLYLVTGKITSTRRAWTASLCLLVAAGVREEAILLFPALFIWLWHSTPAPKTRTLLALISPLLVCVLLAGLALFVVGKGWSGQAGDVSRNMLNLIAAPSALFNKLSENLPYLFILAHQSLGITGWALAACSLLLPRTRRLAWCLFVIPIPFFALLYSAFEVFPRYALRVVFFVSMAGAFGLASLLESLKHRTTTSRYLYPMTAIAAALMFLIIPARMVSSLPSAHPGESWKQINTFITTLQQHVPHNAPLMTDPAARHATSLVDFYTLWNSTWSPHKISGDFYSGDFYSGDFYSGDFYVLRAENEEAVRQANYWELNRTPILDIATKNHDIQPVETAPLTVHSGNFSLWKASPWGLRSITLPLPSELPAIFWINLRDAEAAHHARIQPPHLAATIHESPWLFGTAMQPTPDASITLSSEHPIPANPTFHVASRESPAIFFLDHRHPPEIQKWFTLPNGARAPSTRNGIVMNHLGLDLSIPIAFHDIQGAVRITLAAIARERFTASQGITATAGSQTFVPTIQRAGPEYPGHASFYFTWDIPMSHAKNALLTLSIRPALEELKHNPFYLAELRIHLLQDL